LTIIRHLASDWPAAGYINIIVDAILLNLTLLFRLLSTCVQSIPAERLSVFNSQIVLKFHIFVKKCQLRELLKCLRNTFRHYREVTFICWLQDKQVRMQCGSGTVLHTASQWRHTRQARGFSQNDVMATILKVQLHIRGIFQPIFTRIRLKTTEP